MEVYDAASGKLPGYNRQITNYCQVLKDVFMTESFPSVFFVSIIATLFVTPVSAQTRERVPAPTANEVTAVFAKEPPRIDGFLDDAIWAEIEPITEFIQNWPDDGAPGTERSEVRVAYDRDFLYFALKFYDRNPELIEANIMKRGGRISRDDHAHIAIDTYLDRRNAYLFEMTALGTQDDATLTDERLTMDSFSWDAVYESETQIDDEGWSMEVSIPFRQLRFPKGDELEFGLMISRAISRKNERVVWPAIGLEYGQGYGVIPAVSQYGTLKGLKNIRRGKNIEFKPYVITSVQETRPDGLHGKLDSEFKKDIGGDLKYGITSSLTMDLTVNTDFAQVEADNVQLNLTRFSLFFPEKREFFLERSGLFEHGNPRSTQTFFSRRIGLDADILAGLRLTGQVNRISVGLLNVEEGNKMGDIFGTKSVNSSVARIRSNVFPRGTVGAIFTNVQAQGRYNRAAGVDAQYRFFSASEVTGWVTQVWDTVDSLRDAAGHISARFQDDLYMAQAQFTSVGRNYRPELGFVRRLDMREYSAEIAYKPVVSLSALPMIRRITIKGDYNFIENQRGRKQSTRSKIEIRAQAQRSDNVTVDVENRFERLDQPFFIRPDVEIPVGDYNFVTVGLRVRTDDSRRQYSRLSISTGAFFNGDRTDLSLTLGFRQSKYLQLEARVRQSRIDLPVENGRFDATTLTMTILGATSRKLFGEALVQYDNFTRNLQSNIRIDWIHTPGSDLFIVFNTSYFFPLDNDELFDPNRNVILTDRAAVAKVTYLVML